MSTKIEYGRKEYIKRELRVAQLILKDVTQHTENLRNRTQEANEAPDTPDWLAPFLGRLDAILAAMLEADIYLKSFNMSISELEGGSE